MKIVTKQVINNMPIGTELKREPFGYSSTGILFMEEFVQDQMHILFERIEPDAYLFVYQDESILLIEKMRKEEMEIIDTYNFLSHVFKIYLK